MGDVEDPVIMVADPLCEWEATDEGKWCHAHALVILVMKIIQYTC
jgi:hypothetical protein